MLYAGQFLKAEVQPYGLFLCFVPNYGLYLDFRVRGVPDDCGTGASDEVFCKRVAVLRESECDGHLVAVALDFVHHSELHDVPVPLCGMLHIVEHFHYFVLFHCVRLNLKCPDDLMKCPGL